LAACGGGENAETNNTLEIGGDTPLATQIPNPSATTDPNALIDNPTTPDPSIDGLSPASVTPDYSTVAPATSTPGTPKPVLSDAPGTGTPSPKPANYPTSYSEAKKINEDTIGWVKVPNTNISYPILYKYDSKTKVFYYNDHDIFGTKTGDPGAGSIISYYNVASRNSIIAGHNMRTAGDMFHELHKVQNSGKDMQTRKNRIFEIRLNQRPNITEWEVFSFYETKENEPEKTLINNIEHLSDKTPAEIQSWIDTQKSRSEVKLDVSVSPDDVFVTLITCGDNYDSPVAQSRLYYFLRGIRKDA
jgi:SrtB family sortase